MNRLLEPFQFPFMVDAMVVGVAVGAVCAVLSCYLVLKGWSLMGDAISHAVLPGIVIAHAVGLPLALGAFLSGLSCAVLTGYIKANSRVKEDTVMGVVFTGLFEDVTSGEKHAKFRWIFERFPTLSLDRGVTNRVTS